MRGINVTRSQESKRYMVIAGVFLIVFTFAVGLGAATRQLTHAIDPDMIEHRSTSTNRITQMTPEPDTAMQEAETRQGSAMEKQAAPTYTCKSLSALPLSKKGNAYAFTANVSTANGASLQKLVYNFGDGTASVTRTSESTPASHTYTKAGSFVIKVTPHFSLPGGKTVTTNSVMCSATLGVPASAVSVASSPKRQESQATAPTPTPTPTPAPASVASTAPKEEFIAAPPVPEQETTVVAAAPKKPQANTAPVAKVEELPKAGTEDALLWFVSVTIVAGTIHMLYKRRALQM